ncbi:hypothetical protein RCF44_08655, partial [Staphylococcus epidermidis]|nr:hypothetical protein [Staphylococcus epidermidis]
SVVSIENNSQPTPDAVQDSDAQAQVEKESGSRVVYKKVGDTLYSAPGMGNILTVKVRYRLGSRNC